MLTADPVDIDLARHMRGQDAAEAAEEAEAEAAEAHKARALAFLEKALKAETPETWAKSHQIGLCFTSFDELLGDALYAHNVTPVMDAYNKLMCSPAAAELRAELAIYLSQEFPEDFCK